MEIKSNLVFFLAPHTVFVAWPVACLHLCLNFFPRPLNYINILKKGILTGQRQYGSYILRLQLFCSAPEEAVFRDVCVRLLQCLLYSKRYAVTYLSAGVCLCFLPLT